MRTSLIRIGNSQGVRIPKVLLEQSGLGTEVELEVEEARIVIRPASHPRQGWAEQFRAMADNGDDKMLDEVAGEQTQWDKDEWEW
jgi:antitoxin MazE